MRDERIKKAREYFEERKEETMGELLRILV